MKTVTVSSRSRFLNELLGQASVEEIVLESSDGQRFVLAPLGNWEGFEIGKDGDIVKNKALMDLLSKRRTSSKRMSLEAVEDELRIGR